jgi:hypothetical protein
MHQFRWLKTLKSLGLEFWLALPLLGIAFWVGGGLVTDRILSRSYESRELLQANTKLKGKSAKVVLAIKVEINYAQGISKVRVNTANSALKQLEFEFYVTDVNQIETAISRELGLPLEQIRLLVHYQVDYT